MVAFLFLLSCLLSCLDFSNYSIIIPFFKKKKKKLYLYLRGVN